MLSVNESMSKTTGCSKMLRHESMEDLISRDLQNIKVVYHILMTHEVTVYNLVKRLGMM